MEAIIDFFREISDVGSLPWDVMLVRILVASVFGFAIGLVSYFTHTSESWNKAVIHSQIAITVISSVIIMVIGYNVASAFGLFGILSLVRFRATLKDTKDTTVFLFAVTTGMACGSGLFRVAFMGSIVLFPILFLLRYISVLRFEESYLTLNCDELHKAYLAFQDYMKSKNIRFRMLSISDKGGSLYVHVYLNQEKCYELARQFKSENKDYISSFKIGNE